MFKLKRWTSLFLVLAMAFSVMTPFVASAQSSWDQAFGSQNTSSEDIAVNQFLKPMFGRLVDGSTGADVNPLEQLLKIFNASVLVLGGVLLAYVTIAGTLSTAHDGEMLGKRWSSIWVPIRTAIGAAAIIPVHGGYATIQMLVMWLALQGVNMANSMWVGFLDAQDPVKQAFYVPPNANRQIREVMNDMFLSNVCTVALRETQSLAGTVVGTAIGFSPVTATVDPITHIPGVKGFAYGPGGTKCGRVAWMDKTSSSADSADSIFSSGSPASAAALVNGAKLNAALQSVHDSNMASAQSRLQQMAEKMVKEKTLTQEEFSSTMNSIITTYTNQLHERAISAYEAQRESINSRVKEGMKRDGFAMAGMYYMAIIRAQDEVTRAISETPATSKGALQDTGSLILNAANPTAGGLAGSIVGAINNAYINSGESKKLMLRAEELVSGANSGGTSNAQSIGEDSANRSWVMKLVSWFVNDDLTLLGNKQYSQSNQNPIIMAKNLGENMTAGAWAALITGGIVLGLSGAGAGVAGDWATVFTPVLFSLFAMLVVPGATLSTYVPMIPFILWVGVMIGWIILVIEGVIGSVIWAVSHLAPDGDGVVGRGGQGYMLVLSLVLRPPLMILGLASSIALMKPLGYFINTTFVGAFAVAVNPGPLGLTQAIAGCVLYAIVMVSVINRVFTLIHVVPDKILRWIGGGGNELGTEATSMESFTAGKTIAAVGATQQLGQLTQGIGQGARDLNRKDADKKNTAILQAEENKARQAQVDANMDDKAHRAGMLAHSASVAANNNPTNPEMRESAANANEMARNARVEQAESDLDHYFSGAGAGGIGKVMDMSDQERSALASSSPEMSNAVNFAQQLQAAKADPYGAGMSNFLSSARNTVRADSMNAKSWEKAASQAYTHEKDRERFSSPAKQAPPPPPSVDED